MWKAFKEFAFKGNVFDLAVAVIIGAAFGKIVTALVESVIMPLIAATVGAPKVEEIKTTINGTPIPYGLFLQAVIDFLIVAIVLFMVVQGINRVKRKQEAEVPSAPEPSEEVLLLREIRDSLKRTQA